MGLERDKRETKLWIERERSNYGNREREINLWKERERLIMRGGGLGSRPKKMYGEKIGGWGRVPFNETYAPSLSTIYDGA